MTCSTVPGKRNHLYVPPATGRAMTVRSVSGSEVSADMTATYRLLSGNGRGKAATVSPSVSKSDTGGSTRTGWTARTVSAPWTTTRSYRELALSGTGSHARNAPLARTGTGVPLMVRVASPVPTEPRMKLESREVISAPGRGYTTEIAIGPVTCGIGGSTGLAPPGPGAAGAAAGTGAVAGRGAPQAANSTENPAAASAPANGRRIAHKLTGGLARG